MNEGTGTGRGVALAGLAIYAGVLGLCLGLGALWPGLLGVPWTGPWGPWGDAGAGLLAGGAVVAGSRVLVRSTAVGRRLAERLAPLVAALPGWSLAPLALAAGVAEEALFRGTLWTLAAWAGGDAGALLATSLLFGAAHGAFRKGFRAWSAFALATGLGLGLLRWVTGGVLAAAVAHALVDLANLPLVRDAGPRGPAGGRETASPAGLPPAGTGGTPTAGADETPTAGPGARGVPDFMDPL